MDNIVAEIVGTGIPKLQDFKLRQEDDRLYLVLPLSGNNGNIISLNKAAIRTLSLCDGTNNINAIARTLAKEYNAEFETVRDNAIKLIRSLEGAKIISTNL